MKKYLNVFFQIFLLLEIIFLITQCANPSSPTGGPKDVTPPQTLKFVPDNYQAEFSSQTVTIYFDEYFVLDNVNDNVIISPMLDPKPTFKIKKKSLVIDFKDCQLEENTTYSIWFGEAVKDLNERNTLDNFYYVFSTGDFVDSLEIRGRVINAFNLQPKQKVYVMLYSCENDTIPCDSLPYLARPDYITQTLSDGSFALCNLADNQYRIFAITDNNKNFLYDCGEEIAFLDTLITPKPVCRHEFHLEEENISEDSLSQIDSIELKEKLIADTLTSHHEHIDGHHHDGVFVEMFMFLELDSTLVIKENKVLDTTRMQLVFSRPDVYLTFSAEPSKIDHLSDSIPWIIEQWSQEKDSAILWFPYFKNDSVQLYITHEGNPFDTLIFALKEPVSSRAPRRGSAEADTTVIKKPKLAISHNAQGKLPFFSTFEFQFNAPLYQWNFDASQFYVAEDSIPVAFPPVKNADPFSQRIVLDYSFKENTACKMIIPENSFVDIYGYSNDSLIVNFSTDDLSSYGNFKILLTLPEESPQVIIQLLTEKEQFIKQAIVNNSREIDFSYLKPQKVKLKLIYDTNPNGKW
ncbi:MAG: Ig-like domain-containing protein, partial [Bacteroidales bacterium]|nr:Ig-like domain-containing protein [Bacteroidales bacterium]